MEAGVPVKTNFDQLYKNVLNDVFCIFRAFDAAGHTFS
jgi:hypothetical protein